MADERTDEQDSEQGLPKPRGRKSVPWRQDPVILARLPLVERRHLKNEPNTTIALALGVDEGTIRNDIKRLRELWLDRSGALIENLRAQKIAELQDIYHRAIDAAEFDEMCERAVLFDDPLVPNYELPESQRQFRVHRDEKGSAQFRGNKAASLGQARQSLMDQAKVLGLIVDKQELTGKGGAALPIQIVEVVIPDERPGQ